MKSRIDSKVHIESGSDSERSFSEDISIHSFNESSHENSNDGNVHDDDAYIMLNDIDDLIESHREIFCELKFTDSVKPLLEQLKKARNQLVEVVEAKQQLEETRVKLEEAQLLKNDQLEEAQLLKNDQLEEAQLQLIVQLEKQIPQLKEEITLLKKQIIIEKQNSESQIAHKQGDIATGLVQNLRKT